MRVLLDECMPRKLKEDLSDHDVQTVPEAGWASKKNGELLLLANGKFDVLLTIDRGFVFQQNTKGLRICVICLAARSNRIKDLRPLMSNVRFHLNNIQPGRIIRVSA